MVTAPREPLATETAPLPKPHGVDRFTFLDVARAIAVVAVFLQHVGDVAVPALMGISKHVLNFGVFGVSLFFLVSGFIIPFSLKRSPSVTHFWISRVFRLFPLYLTILAIVTVAMVAVPGAFMPDIPYMAALPKAFLYNTTMLQVLFGQPDAIGLFWTLRLELLFYLICAILFVIPIKRQTETILLLFSMAFLLKAYQGFVNPAAKFPFTPYFLGTFFFGTLLYQWWTGEVTRRRVTAFGGVFLVASVALAAAYLSFEPGRPRTAGLPVSTVVAWTGAYLAFFALLRWRVRFPEFLPYIGRISYSIYLVHGLFIQTQYPSPWAAVATILIGTAILAPLTYRFIEVPGTKWGKAVGARLGRPKGAIG